MTTPMRATPNFVYLASASPRRRELLAQLGLRCRVLPASIDEAHAAGEPPADYVLRLARDKGLAVRDRARDAPIVSADTAVVVDGAMFGKPADRDEARHMLECLAGRTHEVYTGVAVTDAARQDSALSVSVVRFGPMSDAEIDRYWASGEPVDKAGGYAIQGRAAAFIEEISGSYSGVMGLPLCETARLLAGFGYCLP